MIKILPITNKIESTEKYQEWLKSLKVKDSVCVQQFHPRSDLA